jgi:SRSO17 transposase
MGDNGLVGESTNAAAARKKRTCKFPGCTRVVKAQGHCQGHGAKAKRCSVDGCEKQAQATHESMCKRHWKLKYFTEESSSPEPEPKSIYETILPQSIAFRPMVAATRNPDDEKGKDPLNPPRGKSHEMYLSMR